MVEEGPARVRGGQHPHAQLWLRGLHGPYRLPAISERAKYYAEGTRKAGHSHLLGKCLLPFIRHHVGQVLRCRCNVDNVHTHVGSECQREQVNEASAR